MGEEKNRGRPGKESLNRENSGKSRVRGEITLFLSLILVIMISFLCTALQSARMAGSRYLFSLATEASARSLFAVYDTRAWEQYRILMLSDEEKAMQIGQECIESYSRGGTLFPVSLSVLEITGRETLADNGAAGWERAATTYMEARIPVELVGWLWEQSGLADGLEDLTKWMTGFRDLLKPMIELEKKLCELEKKLSKAVEAFHRGQELLQSLGESAQALRGLAQADAGPEEREAAWVSLQGALEQVKEHTRGQNDAISELAGKAAAQMEAARSLKKQIEDLTESLSGSDGGGLTSALSDLGGYLNRLTGRFDFLEKLPGELESQREFLNRMGNLSLPSLEALLEGDGLESLASLQGEAAGLSESEWTPQELTVTEGTEEDEASLGRLLQLKDWLDRGILALALEDSSQVSGASLGRSLPRTPRTDSSGLLEQAYSNLLYGEYALRYTACYGEEAGAGLQYETEYLIAGESSDGANLAAVAMRLLLLRGAANLGYLLTDEGSRSQAQAVASGISLLLGGFIPATLLAVLILILWAMAEAVCDTRALFAGRRVPFWKNASSWNLSWSRLWSLFDAGGAAGGGGEEGMSYEDYLRILLFLTPLSEKCFRTMETAEENLRADRPQFTIDSALCRAVVTAGGRAAGQEYEMSLEYGY